MPHLLLVADDPGMGGAAHYNHTLLSALAQKNFQLTTLTSPADNPLLSHQKSLGIQQLFLSFDTLKDFGRTLSNDDEARHFITAAAPDLILFSNNCPLSNFAAKRVARQLNIPYMVVEAFVAPYLAERFAPILSELGQHYQSARAVIAVSNENFALLHRHFHLPAHMGQVIHYGRPDIFFTPPNPEARRRIRESLSIPHDAVVIITTARLESVKGYPYQLQAIKQLQSTPLQLHFLWVGPGSLENEIRAAVSQLNVQSHIHLLGQRWDIPDLLDASDIFLLPSELEGMPLAIMEAMAKSLPVIASAVSGIPEELGPTGKLLPDPKLSPTATVNEIVATLTQWARDPTLRANLGREAHARARELFHESLMIDRTLAAIQQSLAPAPSAPSHKSVQVLGATPSGAPIISFAKAPAPPPPPHTANLPISLDHIPAPQLQSYVQYLFTAPPLFSNLGEADQYFAFLTNWVNYLHANILANPASPRWAAVRNAFTICHNFIPAYFTQSNLRDLYSKRGDIIEFTLRQANFPIDHTFPPRTPNSKIKLGILAAHFAPAPETFAALAVFEHLPRDLFEIILYATAQSNHRLEQYCASHADALKILPKDVLDQLPIIRNDNLDILFFATNVTAVLNNVAIFAACRLARHQATSIASVVTTGYRNIDSYISGTLTEPSRAAPDTQSHYREKLHLIDGPIHCFTHGSEINTATFHPTRAQINAPPDAILLASGANVFKIIPELRLTWTKILAQLPTAHLLLYPYGPNWSDNYAKDLFVSQFTSLLRAHNIDPARLHILDPNPTPNRDDIKEFLKLADLYLDSFPFAGSTSIIDPLEVALPTIVRSGTTLRSNMSAALLTDLGIPDLIAPDESAYINLAVELAQRPEKRSALSHQIRTRMAATPNFLNPRSYAQKFTTLFNSFISPN